MTMKPELEVQVKLCNLEKLLHAFACTVWATSLFIQHEAIHNV